MNPHSNTNPFLITRSRYRHPGFSLVELMVSIAVGLVVVGGVISIFASAVKSHTDTLRMTRLNQELRVTMNLMTRELRRAGFWGDEGVLGTLAGQGGNNVFLGLTVSAALDCITFNYDHDNDGVLDTAGTDERRGFGWDGSAVEVRSGGAACGAGTWFNISDENAIVITALTFTRTATPLDIDGAPVGGAVPCTLGTPAGNCTAGSDTSAIPTVPVNDIVITLTGALVDDDSVTRTLRETVRVYQ